MLDKEEIWKVQQLATKQNRDKAIHSLEGILNGIYIDKDINELEIKELSSWCDNHLEYINRNPFNEIIPRIHGIIDDGIVTDNEYRDLKWFIQTLTTKNEFYDVITSDIQRLQGVLHGILADNKISDAEINSLKEWLLDNEQLIGIYPFDELESLVIGITQDGKITNDERDYLLRFISDFVDTEKMINVDHERINKLKNDLTLNGVCTINPQIEFANSVFCFTGPSKKIKRKEFEVLIQNKGGLYKDSVLKNTKYLIIGSDSNPCWAYSCYGRKVETAMNMRREGVNINLIKEIDFWDCYEE
jgi:NAD-dependent DNA ligase